MKKYLMNLIMLGISSGAAMATPCDTLRGALSTQVLTADKSYILEGTVSVADGDTLTIHPNVVICALPGSALVIEKGGKLYANGTAGNMITFTSAQPPGMKSAGGWRGVVLLGRSENNETDGGGGTIHVDRGSSFPGGGTNNNDHSGVLQYVRIEYAGEDVMTDNFKAGLVLNSVGAATHIHHVQVSESLHNGIVALGGTVGLSDIYLQNNKQQDLYIDYGYRGQIEQLLVVKNTAMTSFAAATKGLLVSNNPVNPSYTPLTYPVIDAFTFIGPQQCDADPNDESTGLFLDNNSSGSFTNGVVSGFNTGFHIEDGLSAIRTNSDLMLRYVSLVNNSTFNYDYNSTHINWFTDGCEDDMADWINDGCENESVQEASITLGYDASICEDFCETAPTFRLGNSALQNREMSALKVGVLQTSPGFTWVTTCPAASCCAEQEAQGLFFPLKLYPNPGQHTVQMVLPDAVHTTVTVRVIHIATGQIVYRTAAMDKADCTLDISAYPMGHYLVQVITPEGIYQSTLQKTD